MRHSKSFSEEKGVFWYNIIITLGPCESTQLFWKRILEEKLFTCMGTATDTFEKSCILCLSVPLSSALVDIRFPGSLVLGGFWKEGTETIAYCLENPSSVRVTCSCRSMVIRTYGCQNGSPNYTEAQEIDIYMSKLGLTKKNLIAILAPLPRRQPDIVRGGGTGTAYF